MLFCSNRQLLSLIKSQDNDEAKSLIEDGNLHTVIDSAKNTLLHFAAEYKNSEIVQFLIESGSPVDTRNNLGQTPLARSFKSAWPCHKVIELLLRAGADINSQDNSGACVVDKVDDVDWLTEDVKRYEILKMFLECGNMSYLDCFVLVSGNENAVKSLLETDVNLSTTDSEGKTLVHALAVNSNPGVVELLRNKKFDVDARDRGNWTPLMYAAKNNIDNNVEFLLEEGADIEATNCCKETALYLAFIGSDDPAKRTIQVLLEHGANVQLEIVLDDVKTVFDQLLINEDFELAHFPLAHLALQEALGTPITSFVRSKINSTSEFKLYFEQCRRSLPIEIHTSVTVLDALTASERKMERYLCNAEVASKTADFQTAIDYFDTILCKRFAKARIMIALRKTAVQIISQLIKLDYDSYPFVLDEIASYLEEQDIECLKLIENDLC